MKKKRILLWTVITAAVLAAVVLWPAVIGVPVDKTLDASLIAENEAEASETLRIELRGRAYLFPFSGEMYAYRGKLWVERFMEEGNDPVELRFHGGYGTGNITGYIKGGKPRYTGLTGSVCVKGIFDRLLLNVWGEQEEEEGEKNARGWESDTGPMLVYPRASRAEANEMAFALMGYEGE